MADIISDDGLIYKLQALVNAFNTNGLVIHLYQNNYAPALGMLLSDFTECTFDGYATNIMPVWSTPTVASHVATSTAAPVVFSNHDGSVPNTVYGYYVTNGAGTVLYWAGRYTSAPFNMNTAGQTFTVTLSMTDQNT